MKEEVKRIMADKGKYTRYSFAIQKDDEDVLNWIREQKNMSQSIRLLILQSVKNYGTSDFIENAIINSCPGNSIGTSRKSRQRKEPTEPIESKENLNESSFEIETERSETIMPVKPQLKETEYVEKEKKMMGKSMQDEDELANFF